MECIKIIDPISDSQPTTRDIVAALAISAGAKVSNMPSDLNGQEVYSDQFELFDPEKVRKYEIPDLPEHWRMVWKMHNAPQMGDCVHFRYRYVHVPIDILPHYPRIPCKGIFCLDNRKVKANRISANDLIFIGNEFQG